MIDRNRSIGSWRLSLMDEGLRFLSAGLGNTAFTILVYQALLFCLNAPLAYAFSWLIGLAIVSLAYPSVVFRKSKTVIAQRATLALVYVTSFFLGLAIVDRGAALGYERVAILVALAITFPCNFVLMRLILRKGEQGP